MQKEFMVLEFDKIIDQLIEFTNTEGGKRQCGDLEPSLSEKEVKKRLFDTTEARKILDAKGNPPTFYVMEMEGILQIAEKGGMLQPSQLELVSKHLTFIKRLKQYMEPCKELELSLAYYGDDLHELNEIRQEIEQAIRNSKVDDMASTELKNIRREIEKTNDRIKQKLDSMLRTNKECYSDSFVSNRNGHLCLPVKKDYKARVSGAVIDKSSTGATLFIEPSAVAKFNTELFMWKVEEEKEECKILYCLTNKIDASMEQFKRNLIVVEKLDFIFAKGKLSVELNGIEPKINTSRCMNLVQGRHPLLDKEECIPLDFVIGKEYRGVVITGPNTGGKTVSLKTVGLLGLMAQSGLHIPVKDADICLNSQILCDI